MQTLVERSLVLEREHEAGQQLDGVGDVVEMGGFHDRVHAAQRQ